MKKRNGWIAVVLVAAAALTVRPAVCASAGPAQEGGAPAGPAQAIEQKFIEVGRRVGPAVVSISTEVVQRRVVRQRRPEGDPFSEFEGDLFDRFFEDFFGAAPEREFRHRGLGTGVIVDPGGYVLTNEHVVHGADKVTVTLPDGREFKGQIKGTDRRSDLAVIQIDAKGLPAAQLGNSDAVRSGQWAIAIGNPFGFAVGGSEPTLTVGVVSALHRSIRIGGAERDYSDLIQTDAAINPGNSGGPLVNLDGEVIGINVAIFSTTGGYQGIGFAIPSNAVKGILDDLIAGKRVLYGWLGVTVQDVSEELAQHFGLSAKEGAIVARVVPGSPGERGGLKDGDVIVGFNGQPIRDTAALLQHVARSKVGEKVAVQVIREGREAKLTVEIAERPAEPGAAAPAEGGGWRGLEVTGMTAEMARRLGLEASSGVAVTEVEPDSAADRAGVRVGDLIFEINRRLIAGMRDFEEAARQSEGDALVKTSRGYFVLRSDKKE
ncbi:MAG: Do family serine endopeptidase [Candidatus Omnitrophica bacterium]|nr:Do family serine endopeptidase [Candidatus Omnitrophota bacterium]